MLFLRWILEMLVMVALVAGALRLHADWHKIEPPIWKWIILAYQGVVAANAATILYAITERREITAFTWALIASFVLLVLPLVFERILPRAVHNSIEHTG